MNRATHDTPTTTTATLLTPRAPAAIATIALSGPSAERIVAAAFRTAAGRSAPLDVDQVRFGLWTFAQDQIPPEHVVLCRTGETEFEMHCHGGPAICQWILDSLHESGCQIVSGTDHERAVHRTIEEAAVFALQNASTLKVAAVLLDQVEGSLTRELMHILSLIRAGHQEEAVAGCARLLERAPLGYHLQSPWRLTLAGPVNAGKSSLVNALVGASRVLVHHEPGTTRDAVDTSIVISSWPVVITDTAGLRRTQESIEQIGIDTAWRRWRESDVGLLIVDACVGWTSVHDDLVDLRRQPTLVVLNKQDLQPESDLRAEVVERVSGLQSSGGSVTLVRASATRPGGTDALLAALGAHFDALLPPPGSAVPFLPEQVTLLEHVQSLLKEERLDDAACCLATALGDCSARDNLG